MPDPINMYPFNYGEDEIDSMTMLETVLVVSGIENHLKDKDMVFSEYGQDIQLKVYKAMHIMWKLHDKLHSLISSMEEFSEMRAR